LITMLLLRLWNKSMENIAFCDVNKHGNLVVSQKKWGAPATSCGL
jgi:hypothetical protein